MSLWKKIILTAMVPLIAGAGAVGYHVVTTGSISVPSWFAVPYERVGDLIWIAAVIFGLFLLWHLSGKSRGWLTAGIAFVICIVAGNYFYELHMNGWSKARVEGRVPSATAPTTPRPVTPPITVTTLPGDAQCVGTLPARTIGSNWTVVNPSGRCTVEFTIEPGKCIEFKNAFNQVVGRPFCKPTSGPAVAPLLYPKNIESIRAFNSGSAQVIVGLFTPPR